MKLYLIEYILNVKYILNIKTFCLFKIAEVN